MWLEKGEDQREAGKLECVNIFVFICICEN